MPKNSITRLISMIYKRNSTNIEKKIKDGIDTVSETVKNVDFKKHGDKLKEGFDDLSDNISETVKSVDFQKQGRRIKSSSQTFFDSIGSIMMFFLKVLAKFIGIILIIVGISTLLSLIVALFTVGITDAVHFPGMDFIDASNTANIPIWLMSMLLFFAIGIPFFFIFYLGLKILVNNLKSIGNVAKFTLLGLWLMAIIGLVITGVKQATEHAFDAKITHNEAMLNIKSGDTLNLKMIGHDNYNRYVNRDHHGYKLFRDESNNNIISTKDIRLIVRSTSDATGSIEIKTYARGSSYDLARERAQNINYNYTFSGKTLLLDAFLITDVSNKFSDQHVEVILYLPQGTILYADDNTHSFHQNYNSMRDILKTGMEEHYLKVIDNDVECLDCEEEIEEEPTKKTLINETLSKKDKPEVSLKIDEDGVDLEINDN